MNSERFRLTEVVSVLQNDDLFSTLEDDSSRTLYQGEIDTDTQKESVDLAKCAAEESQDEIGLNNNIAEKWDNISIFDSDTSQTDLENSLNERSDSEKPKRGRKRIRNEPSWKKNIRKRRRQAGESYTSVKGDVRRARKVKTKKDCQGKCKFRCSQHFSQNQRKEVFDSFWKLNDSEKNTFYANTTDCQIKDRKRGVSDRRRKSVKYFLVKDLERIRVCKVFYLTTLDISNKRIDYFHKRTPCADYSDMRGRKTKSRIPKKTYEEIKQHINSYPRIESHYCRASSKKEYLEAGLSPGKMYKHYKRECAKQKKVPAPLHYYRQIFKTEFNIGFFQPKKVRCDTCEEYAVLQRNGADIPPVKTTEFQYHMQDTLLTKQERDKDRNSSITDQAIVTFDMQNVITCPRSNVSNFFYKRKLNIFNLTGHCSLDSVGYNIVWNETVAGRGANEIASAVTKMLETVIEKHPTVTSFILWSDSCLPQNRNSIMSFALKKFMESHKSVTRIIQKFCTPGHSSIQEVDNLHSHLEKAFKTAEMYSPISVIRTMKEVKEKMVVIEMKSGMIFDFQEAASKYVFKDVPYSKVKCACFNKYQPFTVYYKLSFCSDFEESSIQRLTRQTSSSSTLQEVKHLKYNKTLSAEKVKDIKSMLKFMPNDESLFMRKICQLK